MNTAYGPNEQVSEADKAFVERRLRQLWPDISSVSIEDFTDDTGQVVARAIEVPFRFCIANLSVMKRSNSMPSIFERIHDLIKKDFGRHTAGEHVDTEELTHKVIAAHQEEAKEEAPHDVAA